MPPRATVTFVLMMLGLLSLGLVAWLRAGRSSRARAWMSTGPTEGWMAERVVLLGLPLGGAALLCAAALSAPVDWPVLRIVGGFGLVLLTPFVLWFILAFIPMPGLLYPRWARTIRERRKDWSIDMLGR
ncbi:hypothetical protein [Brachybacterium huguangmaarense]